MKSIYKNEQVKEELERNFDRNLDIVWNEQMYSKLQ